MKRLYVSHENDNLPAIIAEYALGGRILYMKEIKDGRKRRFGVPRRNDLVFVHELGPQKQITSKADLRTYMTRFAV